ncbi:MAG: VCBS repeat-containing protein [Bacteroidales bacterium]
MKDIHGRIISLLHFPVILLLTSLLNSCVDDSHLLNQISPSHSGITFENTIIESDSVNQLDNGNVYNGGGTGIGDFNNDGLPDIFFTGNMVSCRLYINRGNFRFDDVTEASGVSGNGKWCRGVAVTDINNDGLQDIYVSATISSDRLKRKNLLYVNMGYDKKGVPRFEEKAEEYGLADDSHTTQAAFFDYDNDGDLDVYLVVNEVNDRNAQYLFKPVAIPGTGPGRGKLLRNDFDSVLSHPVFTEVTLEAGIGLEGFGNQATITDINLDGWKDIYVSNDYLSPDLLWINNHDGTFTESLSSYFRHTSNSAMGNDAADINNDGLIDFFTLDMNPEDNYRKKMMLLPSSYQFYQNSDRYGYNYQYTRNTLQLNQGPAPRETNKNFVFSEIAYHAGVEATDWSWCTLLADFDNDGLNDIFIANGFPRDITDRDFGMYRGKAWKSTPKEEILKQIPMVRIHNYIYRNNGDLTFKNMSENWGLGSPTFSNGASTADLDRDGDLDLVINNINSKASLYRNMSREKAASKNNFLEFELESRQPGRNGIGAFIEIYHDNGKMQVREISPFRGYLSTSSTTAHFGLGTTGKVDSATITWQGGAIEKLKSISVNQIIKIKEENATARGLAEKEIKKTETIFSDITINTGVNYVHEETDYVDFNIQKLIPHKFSEYGPALAAGDLDMDGNDDLVTGGSADHPAQILFQQKDGTFKRKTISEGKAISRKTWDDMGILLFDIEGDGDNDLYIASGGYENENGSKAFLDHLYINDGKGNFTDRSDVIPLNAISKGCVRAADIDNDGDLDIFVSGRVKPWSYPLPVSSFIYRNDSRDGEIVLTDVTSTSAAELIDLGMVCDASFADYDNDGWVDLIIAGEWMPLVFLHNDKGIFRDATGTSGCNSITGWWNSIAPGDFDNDGDIDFVAGNLGLNSFYRASTEHPVTVFGKDFDNNGSFDAFLSLWLLSDLTDTIFGEHPAHGRDDLIKQMLPMRARFPTFKSLARARMNELFTPEQLKGATILKSNEFRSAIFRNDGNGKFSFQPLPVNAQLSALNGMITDDFDGDGKTDLLVNTNDYSTEVLTGRYDALSGLLLKGDGTGSFSPQAISSSGVYIPGNGKALVKFRGADGTYRIAASENRGPLRIFRLNRKTELIPFTQNDKKVRLQYGETSSTRVDIYNGYSFLSQSSRFILAPVNTTSVTLTDRNGKERQIILQTSKTENR